VIILKDYIKCNRSRLGSKEVAHKIEFDSRKKLVNDVFVAIRGSVSDGMIIFKSNRTREQLFVILFLKI
jgi:UDP-N-acetylmuramyl pentapeptide synthase